MLSKMSGCIWKMSGKCQNRPESVPKRGGFRTLRDVLILSGIYTETWWIPDIIWTLLQIQDKFQNFFFIGL